MKKRDKAKRAPKPAKAMGDRPFATQTKFARWRAKNDPIDAKGSRVRGKMVLCRGAEQILFLRTLGLKACRKGQSSGNVFRKEIRVPRLSKREIKDEDGELG